MSPGPWAGTKFVPVLKLLPLPRAFDHHQPHTMIQAFLQRLARWLDRPLFPWKKLVVGFSLAEFTLENWLLFRQYRVLQRTIVPKALNKEIDQETFDKSQVRRASTSAQPRRVWHAESSLRPCRVWVWRATANTTLGRHTVAQRPNSASPTRSSTRPSTSLLSTSTSTRSSGASPARSSSVMPPPACPARSRGRCCSYTL